MRRSAAFSKLDRDPLPGYLCNFVRHAIIPVSFADQPKEAQNAREESVVSFITVAIAAVTLFSGTVLWCVVNCMPGDQKSTY